MDLRNWILERITPAVMIVATPEAEAISRGKNGLTLADLLRPHGYFHHLSVPVRTVGETSYRIRELRLRFYHSQTMAQPTEEMADEHLQKLLSSVCEQLLTEDPPSILTSLSKGEVLEQSPWYEKYRHEFFRMLAFSEHECYDHPVACLFVVHSHAKDPADELRKLQTHADFPPLMRQGLMEPEILHHCLVLHDGPDGAAEAEEKIKGVRSKCECACSLLKINTVQPDTVQNGKVGHAGLWRAHFRERLPRASAGELPERPTEPEEGLGAALSPADLESIAGVLQDFTVRYLLPHLELRIRALNQQVLATRKGLRNQLRGLLWRGKSGAGSGLATEPAPRMPSASGPSYGAASIEGQTRALADVAFVMQDYELAASTLRVLASDLKSEKAWKHYAGAQEMLALASFMSGAAMPDVQWHFREAYKSYSTAAQAAREPRSLIRYATRTAMLLAEYSRAHRQFTDAHLALMRAHYQEDNLRSALLLEQSALFQLHTAPALLRKYAFHTVLAGLRYNSCRQQQLGMNAYKQVLPVYDGRNWAYIEEHLHDVLGKQLREGGGQLHEAARHFMAHLPCAHNSEGFQGYYLQQFLDTVQEAGAAGSPLPPLELPVPIVDVAHVRVRHEGQVCHADAHAPSQPEQLWKALEQPMVPASEGAGSSWLDSGGSRASLSALAAPAIVADEPLTLTVPVRNPMAVTLTLSRLRLACTHGACQDAASLSDFVQVEEVELDLSPGESVEVSMSVRPLQPGMLALQGIAWTLNDTAPGFRPFPAKDPPPARRSTGGARLSYIRDHDMLESCSFNVIAAMPRLEVRVENEPQALLQGQLHCCRLLLRNRGATPLKSLRVSLQHPDVLLAAPSAEADLDPLVYLSDATGQSQELRGMPDGNTGPEAPKVTVHAAKHGVRVHAWPPSLVISPGETLAWRMWLHPRTRQPLPALLSWCYEAAAAADSGMRSRVLRMARHYDVLPALEVRSSLVPSHGDLQRCLLRLDLDNSQGMQQLQLSQVACSSPNWRLSSITANGSPAEAGPSGRRLPGSSASSPAPCSALAQHVQVPAGAHVAAFFHLYPITRSGATVTSGVRWLQPDAGPLTHFQQRPVPLSGSRMARETRQAQDAAVAGSQPPRSPFAGHGQHADDAADMLVTWQASRPDASDAPCAGAVHVLNCKLQEGQGAVRAVAQAVQTVRHDFATAHICTARLTLQLRNCLLHRASISVEAGHLQPNSLTARPRGWQALPDAGQAADAVPSSGPPPTPDYVWCGRSRIRMPDLAPGQHAEVHMQVAVFSPGTYEVSDYAVAWTSASQAAEQGSIPGPAFLLTVEQMH